MIASVLATYESLKIIADQGGARDADTARWVLSAIQWSKGKDGYHVTSGNAKT